MSLNYDHPITLPLHHPFLSVDYISVFVFVLIQTFFLSSHSAQAHTYTGESTVVEQVLHSNLTG